MKRLSEKLKETFAYCQGCDEFFVDDLACFTIVMCPSCGRKLAHRHIPKNKAEKMGMQKS